MRRERRNVFAFFSLFCGIASWVPLMVVLLAPLAYAFGAIAYVTAAKRDQRNGLNAAFFGMFLATVSLLLQGGLLFFGQVVSWVGEAFR